MLKSKISRLFTTLALVALMFTLTHCGQNNTDPSPGTFTYIYTKTLKTACIQCHVSDGGSNTTQNGAQLDFSTQVKAYQTLTSSTVHGGSSVGTCAGVKIVNATPATSYLEGVLSSTYHVNNFAGVSGCIPYAGHLQDQHLSDEELTSIETWIKNGATNN